MKRRLSLNGHHEASAGRRHGRHDVPRRERLASDDTNRRGVGCALGVIATIVAPNPPNISIGRYTRQNSDIERRKGGLPSNGINAISPPFSVDASDERINIGGIRPD
jgi:hypothetical protein